MTGFLWVLLGQLVQVDAWVRTGGASPISPFVALLVLALICALTIAIERACSRAVRTLVACACGPCLHVPPDRRRPDRAICAPEPSGAQGPRAPAAALVG